MWYNDNAMVQNKDKDSRFTEVSLENMTIKTSRSIPLYFLEYPLRLRIY